jgi:hypothetical protein
MLIPAAGSEQTEDSRKQAQVSGLGTGRRPGPRQTHVLLPLLSRRCDRAGRDAVISKAIVGKSRRSFYD